MAKSVESTPLQNATHTFYRWYKGAEVDEQNLAIIQSYINSPISLEQMRHFSSWLRRNDTFIAAQAPLIEKWRARMESSDPLSEREAQTLLEEMFASFDHALLFEQGVTANSTLVERGKLGDSELRFPGTMPCWTLHLSLRGTALFLNEHMEQEVGPGDMMLFRPDARYHYGLHPTAQQWEHLWALFQPRPHWTGLLDWTDLDGEILYLHLPRGEDLHLVEKLFRQLIALKDDPSPYRSELQYNRLEEILIRAREHGSVNTVSAPDRRIQVACEFMQLHLTDRFSIDDVAAACNLSTSRFSHLFKQQMGIGPKAWASNARLQLARKLLLNSTDSISSIAQRTGYEDPGQFTKYFRKNLGCSPREFRKSFSAEALPHYSEVP
jgi:AraC family transcriptional regulator of arabinose operon